MVSLLPMPLEGGLPILGQVRGRVFTRDFNHLLARWILGMILV
jgi:hypothetical protein